MTPRSWNRVFVLSVAICLPVAVWGAAFPAQLSDTVVGLTTFVIAGASWWWLMLCTGFVALAGFLAFGPYGRIRLGADDDRPEFSTASWIAMLFAGGMGSGLLFWGVAEPMSHFTAPPGMAGSTPAAAREAMTITMLHWGVHAWSIYAACALVIAYFTFRLGRTSMISTPVRALLGERSGGPIPVAADVLGVVAVVFGLAGSLAQGTLQVRSGLNTQLGVPANEWIALLILLVLFVCYMLSATTGVDKGIKILSNLNMVLAVALMLFIIFAGPTRFIFETFIDTLGSYIAALPERSFRLYPFEDLTSWSASWTLTYLIWWLAWGPFIGIFIARISRGRTIREFCAGVILVPTLFSVLWFAAFGGSGFYIELFGLGNLGELVSENVADVLFVFFQYFPLSDVLGLLAIALVAVFLITSADSGTYVLAMMTSEGRLDPPLPHKMTWGVLIIVITTATVFAGSIDAARAMAAAGAIPFSVVLVLQILGFFKALRREKVGRGREKAAGRDA
jgi:glycine betaine transporter